MIFALIADGTNSGRDGIPQWRKNFGIVSSRMRFFNRLSARMAFKTFKNPKFCSQRMGVIIL
jgi:hypothetical protein